MYLKPLFLIQDQAYAHHPKIELLNTCFTIGITIRRYKKIKWCCRTNKQVDSTQTKSNQKENEMIDFTPVES